MLHAASLWKQHAIPLNLDIQTTTTSSAAITARRISLINHKRSGLSLLLLMTRDCLLIEVYSAPRKIKTYPPPPSARAKCPEPLVTLLNSQIAFLDPRGSRTRLFSNTNPDAAKIGNILLVRFKSGDPFAGVCLNVRRRGVDTSILLRNTLTRIGTELWVKIYSPTVVGIEVVERTEKRPRRARLYYMRYVLYI